MKRSSTLLSLAVTASLSTLTARAGILDGEAPARPATQPAESFTDVNAEGPYLPLEMPLSVAGGITPMFPEDPLNPSTCRTWVYQPPVTITSCHFDPATRTLDVAVDFSLPSADEAAAKKAILDRYPTVAGKASELLLRPQRLVSYELQLQAGGKSYALSASRPEASATSLPERLPVRITLPSAVDPDHLQTYQVVFRGLYSMRVWSEVSVSLRINNDVVRRTLEKVRPHGDRAEMPAEVIISRDALAELKSELMRNVQIVCQSQGRDDLITLKQQWVTRAIHELDENPDVPWDQVRRLEAESVVWNTALAKADAKADTTRGEVNSQREQSDTVRHLKQDAESWQKQASTAKDAKEWYESLRTSGKLTASGSVSIIDVLTGSASSDMSAAYDSLDSGKWEVIRDLFAEASSKQSFSDYVAEKFCNSVEGKINIERTRPKPLRFTKLMTAGFARDTDWTVHDSIAIGTRLAKFDVVRPLVARSLRDAKKELLDAYIERDRLTHRREVETAALADARARLLATIDHRADAADVQKLIQPLSDCNEALRTTESELSAVDGRITLLLNQTRP